MRYEEEPDEARDLARWEFLARLLVPVRIAGHVLFYDALPALLAWGLGSARWLDLFSAFDNPTLRRLTGLGIFLSIVAAIMTTESVTRLARPFSLRQFLATTVVIGVALFPPLADWHRIRLGLAPEYFALLQSYSYLVLKITVGILIGASVSWVLVGRYTTIGLHRPQYTRK